MTKNIKATRTRDFPLKDTRRECGREREIDRKGKRNVERESGRERDRDRERQKEGERGN